MPSTPAVDAALVAAHPVLAGAAANSAAAVDAAVADAQSKFWRQLFEKNAREVDTARTPTVMVPIGLLERAAAPSDNATALQSDVVRAALTSAEAARSFDARAAMRRGNKHRAPHELHRWLLARMGLGKCRPGEVRLEFAVGDHSADGRAELAWR